jgi:hypothetical protein
MACNYLNSINRGVISGSDGTLAWGMELELGFNLSLNVLEPLMVNHFLKRNSFLRILDE